MSTPGVRHSQYRAEKWRWHDGTVWHRVVSAVPTSGGLLVMHRCEEPSHALTARELDVTTLVATERINPDDERCCAVSALCARMIRLAGGPKSAGGCSQSGRSSSQPQRKVKTVGRRPRHVTDNPGATGSGRLDRSQTRNFAPPDRSGFCHVADQIASPSSLTIDR